MSNKEASSLVIDKIEAEKEYASLSKDKMFVLGIIPIIYASSEEEINPRVYLISSYKAEISKEDYNDNKHEFYESYIYYVPIYDGRGIYTEVPKNNKVISGNSTYYRIRLY